MAPDYPCFALSKSNLEHVYILIRYIYLQTLSIWCELHYNYLDLFKYIMKLSSIAHVVYEW